MLVALLLPVLIGFAVLRVLKDWLKPVGLPSIALSLLAYVSLPLEVDLEYVWGLIWLLNEETPPFMGALMFEP